MTKIPVNRFYELLKSRIEEIQKEINNASSELVKKHLEKSLEHNKMILEGLLRQESHADKYH